MEKEKYLQDLEEIKDIMNRSSRFISLSGLSGIFAGIFALGGAYAAYRTIYVNQDYLSYSRTLLDSDSLFKLLLIAVATIALSVITGIYFTTRETKRNNQKIWDYQTKRLLINFAIPLVSGGLLCLILLIRGYVGLVAPLTLVFYGLSLVNASKYTLNEIRSLGIAEIVLGLLAAYFIGFGLLFWSVGFGVLHIVYGILMHMRYSK